MLRAKGLAVEVTHAEKDKVTRLMEYEGCFERGEVYFLPGNDKGIEQLLAFPNGAKDDMCLV
jgi:phage terminase large subunit-like protein